MVWRFSVLSVEYLCLTLRRSVSCSLRCNKFLLVFAETFLFVLKTKDHEAGVKTVTVTQNQTAFYNPSPVLFSNEHWWLCEYTTTCCVFNPPLRSVQLTFFPTSNRESNDLEPVCLELLGLEGLATSAKQKAIIFSSTEGGSLPPAYFITHFYLSKKCCFWWTQYNHTDLSWFFPSEIWQW